MRASSSHCSARRSISAIRSAARRLASVTTRPSSSSHARSAGDASARRRRSMAGSNSASSAASSRSVGISRMPGRSPNPLGAAGSALHGARNASSSCMLRHWRTSASRPERRFARGRGCAGGIGAGNAGDLRGDLGDARVEPVEPLPRRRDGRGPGVVGGLQIPLQANERRRSGAADGVGERPQRVAQAFEPSRDPGSCRRQARAVPAATSADGPRGSRCPPPRHRAAAAASATACRTSCRSAPRAVPGPSSCAAHSPCAGRAVRPGCSRSRRPSDSPAAQAPCWSATCDARRWRPDAPGSCPAAASGRPDRRRSRRTPRSCARACAGRASAPSSAALRGGERPADPPGDAGRDEPQEQDRRGHRQRGRSGRRQQDRRRRGDDRGDPHRPDRRRKLGAAGRVVERRRSGSSAADGFHSSSRRCVTSIRHAVRAIASRLTVASYGQEGERQRRLRDVPAGRRSRWRRGAAAAAPRPASAADPG